MEPFIAPQNPGLPEAHTSGDVVMTSSGETSHAAVSVADENKEPISDSKGKNDNVGGFWRNGQIPPTNAKIYPPVCEPRKMDSPFREPRPVRTDNQQQEIQSLGRDFHRSRSREKGPYS